MSEGGALEGRTALLTGAGSGIGRCLAGELAGHGARLVLTDRTEDSLRETVEQQGIGSSLAGLIVADLMEESEVERLAAEATALGPIDVLYNNAGIMVLGQIRNLESEDFARLLRVNLEAPVQLTRLLLPGMIERGCGWLGFTSSASGLATPPGAGAYGITKAGIVAFSEALRAEVARHGISVTTVCPGFVHSPLAHTSIYRDRKTAEQTRGAPRFVGSSPEKVARIAARALVRRRGRVIVGGGERTKLLLKNTSQRLYGLFNRGMARLLLDR